MNLNLLVVTPLPAKTSEDRLLLSLIDLESIADNMVIGISAAAAINECVRNIRGRGYNAIQSGLGNKPALDNELPYIAFREIADRKFQSYQGRAKTDVISSFKKSIELGLETGNILTDSNPNRAKTGDKTGDKTTRAASVAKPFNAIKVCDSLCGKYTVKQIDMLIIELQKAVS